MEPFIGQVILFGGNFAPRGWALCEGQLLAVSSNEALFSILGTTYGGDGRTTFGLPDLRGRVAAGQGNGPGLPNISLGEKTGAETVTLNQNQLPAHSHNGSLPASTNPSDTKGATGNALGTDVEVYNPDGSNLVNMAAAQTTATGGNQAHENKQPVLAVNYIIALFGTYPSRS